jgi:hypothetical protein
MTKEEIEHLWKVASNNPHHDFNWFDPVVVKFANLVAEKEYERGFIDGMQKQMQLSVDKAVNAMGKREWVGLNAEDMKDERTHNFDFIHGARWAEEKLKEKNNG